MLLSFSKRVTPFNSVFSVERLLQVRHYGGCRAVCTEKHSHLSITQLDKSCAHNWQRPPRQCFSFFCHRQCFCYRLTTLLQMATFIQSGLEGFFCFFVGKQDVLHSHLRIHLLCIPTLLFIHSLNAPLLACS